MTLKKLKSVTYSEKVRQVPEYLALAQQATMLLDEILQASAPRITGPYSAPRVHAEWDREEEEGGSILTLHIWDALGEGRARFTPEEMKTPYLVDNRLSRAWDNLLREGLEKMLQAMWDDRVGSGDQHAAQN